MNNNTKIFINFFDGQAIRVVGDIIDRIGEESSSFVSTADEVFDCEGGFVYPAFSDRHAHLRILTLEHLTINLNEVKSLDDLKRKIIECRNSIVVGRGWDESLWNGEIPDRKFIDEVESKRPVVLIRVDGHMAVLNTKAWNLFNPRGEFKGGFIYEEEIDNILKKIHLDEKNGLVEALRHCAMEGVTEVFEMSGDIHWYQKIVECKPPIDVKVFIHRDFEKLDRTRREYGNVELVGIKIFADGSIGAKTAAVSTGYTDGRYVTPFLKKSQIEWYRNLAERLNLQLSVHAIGDLAIRECIEALKNSRKSHRIEHFELVPEEYLEDLCKLGKNQICMQPNFLKWAYPSGLYERNIGKDWAEKCNPFSILREFPHLYLGSDSMPLSPRYGLKLITDPPYPIQKMDLERAIELYCRSKLEKKHIADFIVTTAKLPECEIIMTVHRGKIIFKNLNENR